MVTQSTNEQLIIETHFQHEIQTLNRVDFKTSANWLQMLTQLIEETQDDDSEAAQISLRQWMDERDQLR